MPEPDLKPRLHHLPMGNRAGEDLQFTLEEWEGIDKLVRVTDVLGKLSNLMVARVAFAEACRQRPKSRILLRQASRVVADSGRGS